LLLGLAALSVAAEEEGGQAARVEVGEQAPDFSLSTTDGATLSLASLQGDKPVVLTFFRGTW
jgi:peroxiredoxin